MDEFVLQIDAAKFSSTNQTWNNLRLNDAWSVGYTTSLIVLQEFENKEAWEAFYYASGEQRRELVLKLTNENQSILNDDRLIVNNPLKIKQLSWDLKNLNFQYGRTKNQLQEKANTLYESVKNNGYNLTAEDCFKCVRFRVICETWNGVILRENNTIATLKGLFPHLEYRKTEGDFDFTYAVDYEVFKEDRLVYGLQIKPESYLRDLPYVNKARYANQQKNAAYRAKTGVPVYDVIATANGEIKNQEVMKNL